MGAVISHINIPDLPWDLTDPLTYLVELFQIFMNIFCIFVT